MAIVPIRNLGGGSGGSKELYIISDGILKDANATYSSTVTVSANSITVSTSSSNAWAYVETAKKVSNYSKVEMVIHTVSIPGGNINSKLYSNGVGYDEVQSLSGVSSGNDYVITRDITSFKSGKSKVGLGFAYGANGTFTIKSMRFY